MVTLPRQYRQLALDGRDAIKANPKIISSKDMAPDDAELIETYDARFAEALRSVPPAQRDAVLRVAGNIAAGATDQSGGALTPDTYWKALNMALGATGTGPDRKGGLASWGDHWFVLPDGVTPGGWGAAVQREARDGPNTPVNPDGSPASLQRAFPVAVGNGVYEFRTATGAVVMGSQGGPWRVTVRAK
jgi:hypothetical protein